MKRNRVILLLVTATLLVTAVVASRCSQQQTATPATEARSEARAKAEKVRFPRDMRLRRARPSDLPNPETGKPRTRDAAGDRIQRAMAFKDGGAVFVEVNAIRHSDVVERILACREAEATQAMARFKEQVGIDPMEDVDRVAMHGDLFAASGFFEELKLPPEAGEPVPYGDGGKLYTLPDPEDPEGGQLVIGRVGDDLMLVGEDETAVKQAIDRSEGRGEAGPTLPRDVMQSEVYGRFGPALLADLLGGEGGMNSPLVARVAEIVSDGTVRVLVDDAVSMSLDLETNSAAEGEDLAKAIGGAIAGARQKARAEGNEELAALLDQARVLKQDNGRFGIDVAVPGETILAAMGCGEAGAPPDNSP